MRINVKIATQGKALSDNLPCDFETSPPLALKIEIAYLDSRVKAQAR